MGWSSRYAAFTTRWRWLIAAVVLAVLVGVVSMGVPSFGKDGLTLQELASVDAPEVKTEILAAQKFRIPLNARVQVVRRDPDGLDLPTQRADLNRAYQLTRAAQESGVGPIGLYLPFANTSAEFPASRESSTTVITNIVGYPDASLGARERAGQNLADTMRLNELSGGGRISVTGGVPAQLETGKLIRSHLGILQVLSIGALVLLTALWSRSLIVPVLVAITIGITSLLLLHGLGFASSQDWLTVPAEVLPVVLSVSIGIATDYVLFYLGAFRRYSPTHPPLKAAELAIAETVPVVVTAGATTALGAASLLLAQTGFIRTFAPGLVVAVLAAVSASLLITPVMLAIVARWLYWPVKPPKRRSYGGLAGLLTGSRRRIRLLATAGVLVMVGLASQVTASPLGFNIVTGMPDDSEVSIGARDAEAGFAAGILSPTIVLIEGENLDQRTHALAQLADDVADQPGVAGVIGSNTFERALRRTGLNEELPEGVQTDRAGLLTTEDGEYARFVVVLDAEAFTGTAASDLDGLAKNLPALLAEHDFGPETEANLAGDTALVRRVTLQLNSDLVRVGLGLLVVEIGLLLLALRNLRKALFVVGASLVVTAAAVGATSIFDRWLGDGNGIVFFVPIAAFVLLVSIGVDYGVLMGHALRAEQTLTGASRAEAAIRRASPTITQAGIVLVATFGALAVVPVGAFTQFAVVMSAGVALDTLLVRPYLMPILLSDAHRHPGSRSLIPLGPRAGRRATVQA